MRDKKGKFICDVCKETDDYPFRTYCIQDGVEICRSCFKSAKLNFPYVFPEIPNYCDGVCAKIIKFQSTYELFSKYQNRLSDGEILVISDNMLMSQSLIRKYWWVYGYINNFPPELIMLPRFDSRLYDNLENEEYLNKMFVNKNFVTNHSNIKLDESIDIKFFIREFIKNNEHLLSYNF